MQGSGYKKASTSPGAKRVKTDWISWIMQAAAGACAGPMLGYVLIIRRYGDCLIPAEMIPTFLKGTALIGAGLASIFGDRMWCFDFKYEPAEGVKSGIAGKTLSWIITAAGIALTASVIIKVFFDHGINTG